MTHRALAQEGPISVERISRYPLSSAPKTPTQGACSITIERGRRLALGAALSLAGFAPSTTGRFSGVHRGARAPGEAPDRRHPSTHRLCGGKQIQHLPETTAGAPVMVKGLLAHLGRLVEHEGRGLVAKALGSRFWGHTTLPVGPSRKPGPTE